MPCPQLWGRERLYTMTGVDWTNRYPWIVQDVARLDIGHAIIDAECCCDADDGIPVSTLAGEGL